MIKLRLTGLPAELDRLVDWLNEQPEITVLSTSTKYTNRGSEYHRQYIEIALARRPSHVKKVPR